MSESASVSNTAFDLESSVKELLAERQQLLVTFCEVAGLNPYSEQQARADLLKRFCQLLVDYFALWIFEVQDRIVKGNGALSEVNLTLERLYSRLSQANDIALGFNDKYDESDHQLELAHLNEDLSVLGEQLAIRFEAEDRVLEKMVH